MKTSTRPSRRRPADSLPGVVGTARVDRRVDALLPRLRPGDIAVIDVLDLDRATARSLADAQVAAVVDATDLISGRFPNLGPELLAEAGVALVDRIGSAGLAAIRDGAQVRVHEGSVHAGARSLASGRVLDAGAIALAMEEARSGMASHLQGFTHNSTELLRREQDLLLHGVGLPRVRTSFKQRPVVVVSDPADYAARRKGLRSFVKEQRPVLVGVDGGAEAMAASGHPPQLLVVSAAAEPPSAKVVKAARDVVVVVEPGATSDLVERFERLGARPVRFETTASAADAALLLVDAGDPRVIVTVGGQATLEELLDRGRSGLASTYLTRLKVGSRVVDAATVPMLYSGRVRPRHVLLALLVCVLVVAAAIATTPVGQEWADEALTWVRATAEDLWGRVS